ncbi:MAG: hypothetical protein D3X82_01345 [Candidatus Leucobacter sulfamidivorax]|nr:hypothetical protein [Candidatus Leucobacter sulfamidivorax]
MSATMLRARVYRDLHPDAVSPWQVEIELPSQAPGALATYASAARPSWPEAMQLAYLLLRDLDRTLMYDVHESRAARRLHHTEPTC